MKCPNCKEDDDRVIDSRISGNGYAIRRRRECKGCGRRFTTFERIERTRTRVVKKDGSRVEFEREKIFEGLRKACHKRPVSTETMESIVSEIEQKIADKFDGEVYSQWIGQEVIQKLRALDEVAYVRFASVYKEFKEASQFLKEVKSFKKGKAVPSTRG